MPESLAHSPMGWVSNVMHSYGVQGLRSIRTSSGHFKLFASKQDENVLNFVCTKKEEVKDI